MKLVIFDVDGTISDSQAHILAAVAHGFAAAGLPAPPREETLSIVGLSLPVAIARLAPDVPQAMRDAIVEGYKSSYQSHRLAEPAPLYPGARGLLDRLAARDDLFLGIATGKSRRGLVALCDHHGIAGHFVTRQVADDHPSKPDPSMVHAALADTGCAPRDAVMIGDTTYDIEMGRAAGVATIGVAWGFHAVSLLQAAGADKIVDSFEALDAAITLFLKERT